MTDQVRTQPLAAGVLLAAGAGRRYGTPKGLLRHPDGEPWVARAATVLRDGGCDPVLVVVGAAADGVRELVPAWARVVHAADWHDGMGASLRAGLAQLAGLAGPAGPTDGAGAAVVALVDTPGVTADVVRRLIAAAPAGGDTALARAGYHGVPGHPVLLGRAHWHGVAAAAQGDAGARDYLRMQDVLVVECGDVGSGEDVDVPAYPGRVSHTSVHPDGHPGRDTSRLRPPARRVVHAEVADAALDVARHEALVADRSAGAVVSFVGAVRDHDGGRAVTGIEYVGHPSAADVLRRVAADVAARTDVEAVAVSHRLGELGIGEAALVVAVTAAHRQEAFAAAALMVDEVKHHLPVWKRQVFTDGTDEWVACP